MSKPMKNCSQCSNCHLQDYGYSNYTVEGTSVHCMIKLHPEDGFDNFYGDAPEGQYAETCEGFSEGNPIEIDVDGDERENLTAEQKLLLMMTGYQL